MTISKEKHKFKDDFMNKIFEKMEGENSLNKLIFIPLIN